MHPDGARPPEKGTVQSNNLPWKNCRIESSVDTHVFLRLIFALDSALHLGYKGVINLENRAEWLGIDVTEFRA